ncbi:MULTISPECIES: PBSX family phage terminase large subunit [Mycetohabitans]|uniref:PBSX family phage terminase large subunit n=1 Tax=Mycetohabitans TaxID=2571159 RepID=UPI001F4154D2|nr:PBSX family phage terminase large subunit [Mycetohabitans sp. B3]MCF2133879.1 PBSX family phage terminase large subunit [Mycetohabitans sp. B3]
MNVELPEKLAFLFEPLRYKVAYGGRGSAKSWSFARALLIDAARQPLRIGCFREVQKAIKESVHKLLADQIPLLGLGGYFDVLATTIRGRNGSEFIFSGLADHTVESIKSYEGLDRAWIEEAQTVSERSWSILVPTIRKAGSEIWVTYNPELETDPTHQRFVMNPPPNCRAVLVNYTDNPWFHETELEAERQHCRRTDPEGYKNIWEGQCKPAMSGAIYYNEIAAAGAQGHICDVPYDPMLKVQVVFDLGWNDAMAISLVQCHLSQLRVIDYIEDSHKTLDYYSAELRKRHFNWGKVYLPHDGRSKDFKSGKSAEDVMRALGWDVEITPNMSVEEGIRLTRMTFPRLYFDQAKTQRLVQCLKRYRRGVNQHTGEPGAPLHDAFSHGADNVRYIAVNAERFTNEDWGGALNYPPIYYS